MAGITSLGAGSGIDAESIVKQLVSLERQPINRIQTTNTDLESKVSVWGRIQSGFSALKDAATALTRSTTYGAVAATSADTGVVGASASDGASPGSYAITVQALASAQSVASSPFASSTATVGTGTLTIELGAWNGGQTAFTPNASKPAVQIPITGIGDGSLANIRDLINDSGSGVSATIITDANGARLVLRGPDGEENGFRVTAQDDDGDNTDAAGLSALAFDPAGGVTRMTRTQAASNAQATINGLAVSSATNTFANVADGLSLTVNKVSATPVQVSVSRDKTAMTTKMQAMVTAYNDLVGTIRVQTLYDETSKTGGPLQGDSAANGLLRQIRSLMGSGSTGSSVFGRLSDVGITAGSDGRLTINDTKLQKALDQPDEVRKMMATTDASDANRVGIAERLRLLAAQVTDSGGVIDTRKNSLNATIDRNKDRMTKLDDRVALVEQRLRAQYTALDQSMTKLNGLSGYVTQQLNALSKSA